ncbi:MAG: SDR family NAD(P)-dependent oxidoreductase [Bacteroidota bacterium]
MSTDFHSASSSRPTALITGASSGIGQATARWFWERGWNLVLWARRIDRLEELKGHLEQDRRAAGNGNGTGVGTAAGIAIAEVDVRVRASVESAYRLLPEAWKPVQLLLNNAGLSQGLNAVHDSDPDDVDRVLDTNLKGLINVTRVVVPDMKKAGRGQVLHVSSTAGKETYPGGGVYCASKFGVEALAKTMRQELLPFGVKVGTVSPGMVDTEFSLVRFKGDAERARSVYDGLEPLHAEDVAEVIGFMATRPDHVQIADILVMPKAQAGSGMVHRTEGHPPKV